MQIYKKINKKKRKKVHHGHEKYKCTENIHSVSIIKMKGKKKKKKTLKKNKTKQHKTKLQHY